MSVVGWVWDTWDFSVVRDLAGRSGVGVVAALVVVLLLLLLVV